MYTRSKIVCPGCSTSLKIKSRKLEGKQFECPSCGDLLVIEYDRDLENYIAVHFVTDVHFIDEIIVTVESDSVPMNYPANSASNSALLELEESLEVQLVDSPPAVKLSQRHRTDHRTDSKKHNKDRRWRTPPRVRAQSSSHSMIDAGQSLPELLVDDCLTEQLHKRKPWRISRHLPMLVCAGLLVLVLVICAFSVVDRHSLLSVDAEFFCQIPPEITIDPCI